MAVAGAPGAARGFARAHDAFLGCGFAPREGGPGPVLVSAVLPGARRRLAEGTAVPAPGAAREGRGLPRPHWGESPALGRRRVGAVWAVRELYLRASATSWFPLSG